MNYLDNKNNYYPVVDKKKNGILHLGLIPNYVITVSESNPLRLNLSRDLRFSIFKWEH